MHTHRTLKYRANTLAIALNLLVLLCGCGTDPVTQHPLCAEQPNVLQPGRYFERNLLRFANQQEGVEVVITRDFVEVGAGESAIYSLERFSLTTPESRSCEIEEGALDYTNTHHNWRDSAIVVLDEITYTLEMSYLPDIRDRTTTWVDTLTGKDAQGNVVFGPVELTENSGAADHLR